MYPNQILYSFLFILICFLSKTFAIGDYDYSDNFTASQAPPAGLSASEVPQFVTIGIDDNKFVDGTDWAAKMFRNKINPAGTGNSKTFDSIPARASFYMMTLPAINYKALQYSWMNLYYDGHGINNHTVTHPAGWIGTNKSKDFTVADWEAEMNDCNAMLIDSMGIPETEIWGFRTPFLSYNNNTFIAQKNIGFVYGCAIEEGVQENHDGTNFNWPYTLDNGSEAANVAVLDSTHGPVDSSHNGMWCLPAYLVLVPPDSLCAKYNVEPALRIRLKNNLLATSNEYWDDKEAKITGLDYNMWFNFNMTKAEFVAILKYTLDLRIAGNRAPFNFGAHSDYYTGVYTAIPESCNTTFIARRDGLEEFIDYALDQDVVRVVPAKNIIKWMRNPVALGKTSSGQYNLTKEEIKCSITISPQKTSYNAGDKITITAIPNNANIFDRWAGDITSLDSSITMTVTRDLIIRGICKSADAIFNTNGASDNITQVASWKVDIDDKSTASTIEIDSITDLLSVTLTLAPHTSNDVWEWCDLVADINSNLSGMTGIEVEYKCDRMVYVSLLQSNLGYDGDKSYAFYRYPLPASENAFSAVQIGIDNFFQPDWTYLESKIVLDLSKIEEIVFSPIIGEVGGSSNLQIKKLTFYNVNSLDILDHYTPDIARFAFISMDNKKLSFKTVIEADYSIELFSANGRKIKTVFTANKLKPGIHTISLGLSDIAHGLYILKLLGNGSHITKKMVVIDR